ncbi:hypothetical protein AWB70_01096 [Caballeronia cordobensis]|uniref:DUF2844 domain-containing protein n=1 Tax=Caballeronia cordobensis TaxID=1353886 RepID=A0A158FN89_CABCO|nr:DUF2844 domain-containing protein [Caballeronia cordobensis]SAL21113.1 hypothetical protein AWB70_01096 [Caballeronia cordobensis]
MKKNSIPYYAATGLAMLAIGTTSPAHAQLGATGRAVNAPQGDALVRLQGGLVQYHEATDAHGIVVREYVDSNGDVYAVSWRGPAMANVQALLGTYFDTFREGASASAGDAGLHTAHVVRGDLVVENHVRLREFSGRAWLTSALPPGVSAADIE